MTSEKSLAERRGVGVGRPQGREVGDVTEGMGVSPIGTIRGVEVQGEVDKAPTGASKDSREVHPGDLQSSCDMEGASPQRTEARYLAGTRVSPDGTREETRPRPTCQRRGG